MEARLENTTLSSKQPTNLCEKEKNAYDLCIQGWIDFPSKPVHLCNVEALIFKFM